MHKIPYAVSNFEEIILKNYLFIDKTEYISKLEQYKAPVYLRPRRFGKTLFCSMLECYYDINRKDKFEKLFSNTFIGKNPTKERNSFLVLRFNFSEIAVSSSMEKLEESFFYITKLVFNDFLSYYKTYFKNYKFESTKTSDILTSILKYVKTNNLPPIYIIIDEYDNFTNQLIQTQQENLYQTVTSGDSFLKTFFKVIKAGTEDLSVARCYITGVLPITIDDLTSGFNIAEILTLEDNFIDMLGFTNKQVDYYLNTVFEDYGFDKQHYKTIRFLLTKYYDGYRFSVDSPPLYNSTIITFFFKKFVTNNGKIPQEFIDDNIKTDVEWIKRLSLREEDTKTMLEQIQFEGYLDYDWNMISSRFNANRFFSKEFLPVSLFYLGMTTIKNRYQMHLPNQTIKKIFTDYFNEIEKISVSSGYTQYFIQFIKDLDIKKLFAGYFKRYISQIPAQACDKINENFYRTTFYEICTRYLSWDFVFNIETNYHSGRTDFEMLGKYHTEFKDMKWILEFKHFSKKESQKRKVLEQTEAFQSDKEQILRYEKDILKEFPNLKIKKFVVYTVSCKDFRIFEVK